MSNNKRRVLLIGLDGATFDYLLPMMDAGITPFLRDLVKRGSAATLLSTIPPVTAPAWASLMTGQNPGKHGALSFFRPEQHRCFLKGNIIWDSEKGEVDGNQIINAEILKGKTVWDILGRYKKKSIVINMPLTYPARKINGILITGMLTPSKERAWIFPKSLTSKIPSEYTIDLLDYFWGGKESKLEQLLKDITQMTVVRAETAIRLMKTEKWDFFIVVFVGPDRIAHIAWSYLISGKKGGNRKIKELIMSYFELLDSYIKKLSNQSKGAELFIVSDHGFGPFPRKIIHLREIEELENKFELINLSEQNFVGLAVKRGKWTKAKVRTFLKNRAYPGRFRLFSREELFSGKWTKFYPEFILQSEPNYWLRNNKSNKGIVTPSNRGGKGTHRVDGIFISSDSDLQLGLSLNIPHIFDIAPTILSAMGIPIPRSMDGQNLRLEPKKPFLTPDMNNEQNRVFKNRRPYLRALWIDEDKWEVKEKNRLLIQQLNLEKKEKLKIKKKLERSERMLNKIYHSKTWRLLWIYKRIVGFPKKVFAIF